MRCLRSLLPVIACLALLLAPFAGRAQSPDAAPPASSQAMPPAPPQDVLPDSQTVVRLSDVEGMVRLSDSNGKLFDQVLQNMAMLPGMTIETGNDGRVELEFPDGSVARVTPNSSLALATQGKPNHVNLILRPVKGLTYYELVPDSNSYSIEIGPLTARAGQSWNQTGDETTQQTLVMRVNLDSTPYLAAVLRGYAHFEDASGNATYELQANETASIDPAAATDYDIAQDVTPDTWDAWNADRDAARAQVAGASHPGGETTGPGWNDLNYYGSWYDVPGQGEAWAPDGVGENFDPYGSGAWGYYTGVGYGWVSGYPWGWLPYHCGLWNNYPGYGWMWRPGGCGWGRGAGWYPYSGIGSAPLRYRPPTRPLPPHGVRHPMASQALIAVNQGPAVRFRQLGEPRPAARALVVSGVPVQPLPVEARPTYQSVISAQGYRSTSSGAGISQGGQSGYVTSGRVFTPGSGVSSRIPQPPHVPVYTPAPRASAPAPIAAPHVSAPAGGGGHGH